MDKAKRIADIKTWFAGKVEEGEISGDDYRDALAEFGNSEASKVGFDGLCGLRSDSFDGGVMASYWSNAIGKFISLDSDIRVPETVDEFADMIADLETEAEHMEESLGAIAKLRHAKEMASAVIKDAGDEWNSQTVEWFNDALERIAKL